MKNKTKILAGKGSIYIADSTTAFPTADMETGTFDFSGWTDIGFTEGVTIEYTPTFQDVKADGFTATIKKILTEEEAVITTNIHQRDMDNFKAVVSGSTWAEAGDSSTGTSEVLYIGDGETVEIQVAFKGKNEYGLDRVWYIPVAVSTGSLTYEATNESVPVEVEFTALANTDEEAGGRLIHCYDLTAVES